MKSIFILVNLVALLLFNTFTGQNIEIKVNIPDSVIAGTTVEVEVQIQKGDLKGFARYQVKLPNGVVATPIERAFADFSFSDNTMKLIWLHLPPEETITIRYALKINERLKGNMDLAGTFSFIDDNQRQQFIEPSSLLAIHPSPTVEPRLIVDVHEANQKITSPLPHLIARQNIAVLRQTPFKDANNHFIVNLVINKEDTDKYAKIEEIIPAGFRAENIEAKGGIFTFRDQTVKYIWP